MKAAVVAIGDELTSGHRVDTNSAWISVKLGELGIRTTLHATAPDDLHACITVLDFACKQADIVVSTGGLGPTQDDLTREAVAAVCKSELELHEPSRAQIMDLFSSRGRQMPASNLRQAMLPKGSQAIRNPNGTAPGIDATVGTPPRTVRVFALPGVPAEMREMWAASVAPKIADRQQQLEGKNYKSIAICHQTLKCFGVGESALEEQIAEFLRRDRQPTIGITAHRATITLRLTATGPSQAECHKSIQQDVFTIRQRLGALVFGEGEEELEDAVIRELAHHRVRLVTSERMTRGLLARWLSAADDGSHYAGGVTQPTGTLPKLNNLARCREEASKLRAEHRAEWAIVLGDLVPGPNNAAVPIVVQSNRVDLAKMSAWTGHPDIRAESTAKTALNLLRKQLLRR